MAERWSALWRRGTNFMDKILKGGGFIGLISLRKGEAEVA